MALTLFVFFLTVSSGSIFASSFYNKKYEEVLPITFSSIVIISFLLGIIGLLKYSTIVILLISIFLYLVSIIKVVKNKQLKEFIKNIFTPGFGIFVFLSLFFLVALKGKLLNAWDEFSHWGDIVKVMTYINDFGTNELSNSAFKSYPPGMALMQYFIQRVNYIFCGVQLEEWLNNYSYNLFAISFVIPFISKINKNKFVYCMFFVVFIVLTPFIFYKDQAYKELYIEPFLCFLFGSGLLNLMWNKDDNISLIIHCVTISMLVLAKDDGMLFAAMLCIGYIVEILCNKNKKESIKKSVILASCIIVPKLLWMFNIKQNNVTAAFSKKIDLLDFINIFLGKNTSYRKTAFINYIRSFINEGIQIGESGIRINYLCLMIFFYIIVVLIKNYAIKQDAKQEINAKITQYVIVTTSLTFFTGLVFVYLYKFVEIEAIETYCFNRYSCTIHFSVWIYIYLSTMMILNNMKKDVVYCYVLIFAVVFTSPLNTAFDFATRTFTVTSMNIRDTYKELIDVTNKNVSSNSKIYFLSMKDTRYDWWYFRYCIRPAFVANDSYIDDYIIDEDKCIYTVNCHQWMNELIKDNYDYVAIYSMDDNFVELYNPIFENSGDIAPNSLYRVDKDSKILVRCK